MLWTYGLSKGMTQERLRIFSWNFKGTMEGRSIDEWHVQGDVELTKGHFMHVATIATITTYTITTSSEVKDIKVKLSGRTLCILQLLLLQLLLPLLLLLQRLLLLRLRVLS